MTARPPASGTLRVPVRGGQSACGEPPPITTGLERFAYVGLLAFVVVLYSNIGVLVPALAPLQPAKLIAVAALGALLLGRFARGAALRLAEPQTILVFCLLTLAACSVYGALWPGLAASWLADFAKMAAVYLLIVHVVDRPARFRSVAATVIACSLVPAAAAIRRAVLDIELIEGSRAAWIGLFGDPNELAFSLVLVIPLTVALFDGTRSRLARLGLVGAAVIQVAGVVVTQSRGGLVGLLVVLGFIAWSYRVRAAVPIMVVVVAAIGAVAVSDTLWQRLQFVTSYRPDGAIIGRLEAWHIGWLIFLDRWWLGVGIGNFPLAWPLYAAAPGGKWITAHNAFIQILGELGVLGLIGFVALLATTVIGLRRARLACWVDRPEVASFAKGLGIALWGYLSCSLFLSVAFNWFLYLIVGLSVSVMGMAPKVGRTTPTARWSEDGGLRPWG